MAFKSWQSFNRFSEIVKHEQRYFYNSYVRDFLSEVQRTSEERHKVIPVGQLYCRAQLGSNWVEDIENGEIVGAEECPHPASRMLPLSHKANEGRVNPKGISYLYMATNRITAMSEVRPWLGSKVSLAWLKTTKVIKVVDCSVNHQSNSQYYFNEPDDETKEQVVWAMIDRAFSLPVVPNDSMPDYVPTQIIAEMFRDKGLDGIVYKSLLGSGFSVVLFDRDTVTIEKCELHEVLNIEPQFNECANPNYYNQSEED